jgi:hypothetical protein
LPQNDPSSANRAGALAKAGRLARAERRGRYRQVKIENFSSELKRRNVTKSRRISRELTVFVAMTRLQQMAAAGFTYWQDGEMWLGYLDQYPDYMTQGTSLEDLKEHLLDLYKDLSSGVIPHVRQHSELELA